MKSVVCALCMAFVWPILSSAQDAEFTIDANTDLGPVNRYVMGGNFEFISAQTPQVAALAQEMPIARFPGGDADATFLWSDPNPLHDSMTGLSSYSWSAFASLAATHRIPLLLELNLVRRTSDSVTAYQDAVDWVRDARVTRGLAVPYVGIGNEVWGDWDAGYARFPNAEAYATAVLGYADALHEAFPGIKVVLSIGTHNQEAWNREAIRRTAHAIDAIDYHFYPNHHSCSEGHCPDAMEVVGGADAIGAVIHTGLEDEGQSFASLREMLVQEAGVLHGNRIEIVVGEWDGASDVPFPNPVPNTRYMQWSMADALFYGVMVGEMLHNQVAAAMHYELQGYRFGLIGGNYARAADLSVKRPKAYALQLWRSHFGDRLLGTARVRSPGYQQQGPTSWDGTAGWRDYVKVYASLADQGRSLRLIVVNRHPTDAIRTRFNLGSFRALPTAQTWVLAGDSILAQNENITGGSPLAASIINGTAASGADIFTWDVPAHSVSAVALTRDDLLFLHGFE